MLQRWNKLPIFHLLWRQFIILKGRLCYGHSLWDQRQGHPMSFPETIIGRGHDNVGNFDDKGSSIVGIGGGAVSLVSQLISSIGGKFSYCLVPLTSRDKNSSKLNFGSDAVVSGPGTMSTPLVPKILDTFHFLTLDVTPQTQKGSKHEKNI